MIDKNRYYAPEKYKSIVQEQVYISYVTKGGVSYSDTEKMSPYERKIALDFMNEILEKQNNAYKKSSSKSHKSTSAPHRTN